MTRKKNYIILINHLFYSINTCTASTYTKLSQTTITSKHIKNKKFSRINTGENVRFSRYVNRAFSLLNRKSNNVICTMYVYEKLIKKLNKNIIHHHSLYVFDCS